MRSIDLSKLMKLYNFDKKQIARELFPDTKYPVLALKRILNGEALLDAEQISRLASLTGGSIEDLYTGWQSRAVAEVNVFIKGEYRAELDTSTWKTKIYHKNSMFHEELLHTKMIPLSQYLDYLDKEILKFKKYAK